MTSPDSDDVKRKARSAFIYHLVIWTWKRVVYILILGNIATALAILLAPPSAQSGAAFRLMSSIDLPNSVIGVSSLVGAVLLFFHRTSIAGHFISFLTLAWWTLLVVYIALLLHQPTSLIAASWSGTLAALHLLAAITRWNARSGYQEMERRAHLGQEEAP